MNVILWIIAAVLALAFFAAGLMKAVQPKEKLAASGMGWVEDFSPGMVKAIGIVEVLGALGLVLPALLDIAPVLVGWAAVGLAVTMLAAIGVHARRKETKAIPVNAVLLVLAAVAAWGRLGPHAF